MAGAWGYERDHYDVSRACGERALLPAVRAAADGTVVLADGFSCRHQIAQGHTSRRALHLAQVLELARVHGPSGPLGRRPGDAAPGLDGSRSPLRRGAVVAGVAGAAALAYSRLRR
jgi:hypothetical protein